MCITSKVQEAQQTASQMNYYMRHTQCQGKPYAGIPRPSECSAGKDGTTNPEQSCWYCKDTGHELPNCLQLQKKKDLEAARATL